MRLSLFRSAKGVSGNEISEATQRCLGLRALLPQSEEASLRVLDLGAARTANLDFFATMAASSPLRIFTAVFGHCELPRRTMIASAKPSSSFSTGCTSGL